MQNLTYAIRSLRRTPKFSLLVVLILALGIGANTAVFTLINAALLKPLPYRNPSALVFVSAVDRNGEDTNGCLSYPHFQLLAERSHAFTGIAGFTNESFNLTNASEAIQLQAARVSSNFFDVLGVNPALGRPFVSAEGKPGAKLVAIVSNRFWRRNFNGSPDVIGQSITLDSRPYTVVGVLPASFQFALLGTDIDVWTTHLNELNLMTPEQIQHGTCYLDAVARLAPGTSLTQAQAEMNVLDQQYLHEYPNLADADATRPVQVAPPQDQTCRRFSIDLVHAVYRGSVRLVNRLCECRRPVAGPCLEASPGTSHSSRLGRRAQTTRYAAAHRKRFARSRERSVRRSSEFERNQHSDAPDT